MLPIKKPQHFQPPAIGRHVVLKKGPPSAGLSMITHPFAIDLTKDQAMADRRLFPFTGIVIGRSRTQHMAQPSAERAVKLLDRQ